jgi:electron transfer flavoprotein beta subunit
VSNEIGQPRYAILERIIETAKKQPTTWRPADIGIDPSTTGGKGRRLKLLKLFQPIRESKCEIIEGETLEEAGINLAVKLRESKIL